MKKLFLFFIAICAFSYGDVHHYINKSVVDVFEEPNQMGEIGTQAIYGTNVKIIENKHPWVKIQTPDGYLGWIQKNQMISLDHLYPTKNPAKVNQVWSHLYYIDDTTPHPPALMLPYDAKIEVVSSNDELQGRWMKVQLLDGKVFYAIRHDYTFDSQLHSLEDIAELSQSFLGLPYRWGGSSSFGFDCSGFVQLLYRQLGISLPRNASDQAKSELGKTVLKDQIKKGDLVFFGRSRVTHVGFCLDNKHFIHSFAGDDKNPSKIQISHLDDQKWTTLFKCARRYL